MPPSLRPRTGVPYLRCRSAVPYLRCPTGLRGTPPHLDLLALRGEGMLAMREYPAKALELVDSTADELGIGEVAQSGPSNVVRPA
jgi:hypothetical protein